MKTDASPEIRRGQVLAWGLWDWGSAAYNAVILTFVFSVYLTESVGPTCRGRSARTAGSAGRPARRDC